ncbi:Pre-rrna-processing protein esf1 [Mycena sanguinolenta]|uniref:Pre-rrna-processing protein esf1 n=1 Tax=Mycena sanguinolenta TaxID=230812 RepID=A0A8H6XDT6_9AGAR|nr:Pre-rrna-processing protein esf1 [Mycena sanguinolenta]
MDSRFARLRSDPRFRRPRKEKNKVVVDTRFKTVFTPQIQKGRVDKYGRPIAGNHEHENLRRFYRLEDDIPPPQPDYARGQALLESSDEEDASEDDSSDSSAGSHSAQPINLTDDKNPDVDIDLDEDNFADLDAQAAEYVKSHAEENQSEASQTSRLAAVNLDWDHGLKKSSDRTPKGNPSHPVRGKVLSVRIYPSEFGKERLAREEKEGPPPEIFKKPTTLEEDEINEKNIYDIGDENEYDEDALRKYQLERLRYYYAIITCDTTEAAAHIYSELEGTELERSANVFDLSFVPDGMSFDQECRDEATEDTSTSHKGVDFVTDALRHSKVKLTWDEDDPERNQVTRRTLTRKEIEEADFRAYLASSSSEDESDNDKQKTNKAKQKGASRDKLRSLLLGGGDELPEGWARGEDDGDEDLDMEITFTPGLSESKGTGDETTLEKYQRKMKEKRKKKKESKPTETVAEADEFFDEEDVPAPPKKSSAGSKKRDTVSVEKASRSLSTAEELALLVSSDTHNVEPRHFDMKAIIKAEKQAKRKGKKKKQVVGDEANEMQEDFAINVADSRFQVLHEDPAFAIDPSNPHFKKTKGMNALLEERTKRQQHKRQRVEDDAKQSSDRSLQNLVESVKRNGKRRRIQE